MSLFKINIKKCTSELSNLKEIENKLLEIQGQIGNIAKTIDGLGGYHEVTSTLKKIDEDLISEINSTKQLRNALGQSIKYYKRSDQKSLSAEVAAEIKKYAEMIKDTITLQQEEAEKNKVGAESYTDALVKFLKEKEDLRLKLYNDGKTIGYGFDLSSHEDIKINFNEDGISITEEEAERLLRIVLEQTREQINNFLAKNNLKIDQNTFDALTDLFYNRGYNEFTKPVAFAMAAHDDEKVEELLGNLDKEFAKEYVCKRKNKSKSDNDETLEREAQAYVDRNSGLKERRDDEYNIYKEGIK